MAEFFLAGAPPHLKWCHLSPFVKLPHSLPSTFSRLVLYILLPSTILHVLYILFITGNAHIETTHFKKGLP